MTFRVRIDPLAQREIFSHDLGEHPLRATFFALTGAPYRAYLFRVGRRSRYWIIYTADEDRRTVNVLRFWNASRDPERLDIWVYSGFAIPG